MKPRCGDKVLVERHSAFNLILLTEDECGLRTLRFGREGVPQSVVKPGDPQHLELPYANVLPLCLAFTETPRRMLVVGLGGGTVPSFFQSCFPEMAIDVVEIDADVLDVAKTWCGFSEGPLMRVHVEDGRDFIESSPACYDAIVLDSFDAESIPAHLLTVEFLHAVRAALAPGGIAVANVWNRDLNRLYDHMLRTYREAFEETYIFDVPGPASKIFVALPARQTMTKEGLARRAREISKRSGFRRDMGEFAASFRNSDDERLRGGAVLRD